jgi:hypothetical protein
MPTHNGAAIDQAAFTLGATGVALTPYNLLVEVREISHLEIRKSRRPHAHQCFRLRRWRVQGLPLRMVEGS